MVSWLLYILISSSLCVYIFVLKWKLFIHIWSQYILILQFQNERVYVLCISHPWGTVLNSVLQGGPRLYFFANSEPSWPEWELRTYANTHQFVSIVKTNHDSKFIFVNTIVISVIKTADSIIYTLMNVQDKCNNVLILWQNMLYNNNNNNIINVYTN